MKKNPSAPSAFLKNKLVVITGASSGAGRAAALLFAAKGARVVVAARREAALAGLVREIEEAGGVALAVPTDVTDPEAHQKLAAKAAIFGDGRIDVWVNNAGVLAVGALEDTPAEVQTRVIQTNLLGYMYGASAVLPYFKARGAGVLINNISVGGWLPIPYGTAYSASKAGLRGFTGALQAELSRYPRIHVCGLYPAMLDTPGLQHAANYTGAVLTTMPPVFNPLRVARAMVALARHPQRATTTDIAAPFMRLSYALMPRLTGRVAELIMGSYFRRAADERSSDGNLFDGDSPLTSIEGGWRTRTMPVSKRNGLIALAGAGILAAAFLLRPARR